MTDIRAALEALIEAFRLAAGDYHQVQVERGFHPRGNGWEECDGNLCRLKQAELGRARAALAAASPEPGRPCQRCGNQPDTPQHEFACAASPEPERCAYRYKTGRVCYLRNDRRESGVIGHPFHPAPAAPTVEALREHPGERHTFSMTCDRCGKRGYVNLSVIGPDERLSIEPIGELP